MNIRAALAETTTRRRAGAAAMVAGAIGLVSLVLLIAALGRFTGPFDDPAMAEAGTRQDNPWTFLFRAQDVAVALQALLMIPVALAIRRAAYTSQARGRAVVGFGITGHAGVVLCVALVFVYRAPWAGMLYMLPQGLIGVWLIAVCWSFSGASMPFRAAGIGAGLGFVVLTVSVALIASALGWHILDPTGTPSVEAARLTAPSNRIAHALLPIGTLLGRAIYPIWSIALGWKVLRGSGSSPLPPLPLQHHRG